MAVQNSVLSPARQAAQARGAEAAVRACAAAVWRDRRPADRTLNLFLRNNRQYGARDRQFISECVFTFFRYFGAAATLLTGGEVEMLEKEGKLPGEWVLAALLFTVWSCNQQQIPVSANVWAKRLDLEYSQTAGKSLHQICCQVARRLRRGVPEEFDSEILVPEQWWPWWKLEAQERKILLQELCSRPPLWLRTQGVDRDKVVTSLAAAGVVAEKHEFVENALCVRSSRVNVYNLDAFRKGWFEVQDLASQAIGLVAAPGKGERWWDCCAGAGGKSLQLAELMHRSGTVVAGDIREYKLEDLRRRARRAGFPNIVCRAWDGKSLPGRQRGKYDGVLIDAPCSCSGTWRRNPDARWSQTTREVEEILQIQARLLPLASVGVRPGGVLVYATCSGFERENEQQITAFLSEHPEFVLEAFTNPLDGTLCNGMLRAAGADSDRMFVARMRRKES